MRNSLKKFQTFALAAVFLIPACKWANADDPLTSTPESGQLIRTDETQNSTRFKRLQWSNEFSELEIYGQLNKGALFYDDGVSTKTYFPVDSDKNSTRVGLWLRHEFNDAFSAAGNFEVQFAPRTTKVFSEEEPGKYDWNDTALRKAEVLLESPFGTFWFGQGSMASDHTSEVDLSGSSVTGSSSVSDTASQRTLRLASGEETDIRIDDVFRNFDGLGRKFRIRYDTPSFDGLVFGVSYGEKVFPERTYVRTWDVSAKYLRTVGDYDLAGALSYVRPNRNSKGAINGSFSLFDASTGLSISVSGAHEIHAIRNLSYIYGKLGHRSDFVEWGSTVLSADAYFGNDIGNLGSVSKSFGFQAVQNFDYWRTEAYLSIRSYNYDEREREFKQSLGSLIGLRFKF